MTDAAADPPQSCTLVLRRNPAAASTARGVVGAFLHREAIADAVVTDVSIVLNEAVTNAIRHGGPHPAVTLHLLVDDDAITLRVSDVGSWPPPAERVDPDQQVSLTLVESVVRPRITPVPPDGAELTVVFPRSERVPSPRSSAPS